MHNILWHVSQILSTLADLGNRINMQTDIHMHTKTQTHADTHQFSWHAESTYKQEQQQRCHYDALPSTEVRGQFPSHPAKYWSPKSTLFSLQYGLILLHTNLPGYGLCCILLHRTTALNNSNLSYQIQIHATSYHCHTLPNFVVCKCKYNDVGFSFFK